MIAEHIAQWTNHQKNLHRLCDLLDRFADRLPLVDVPNCQEAVRMLNRTLSSAHAYEEADLFPRLGSMSSQITGVLSIFRAHHLEDRQDADALARLMMSAAEPDAGAAIDQLQIRLPLFVRALRRNVQFEEAICRALFASARAAAENTEAPRRLAS